MAGDTNTGLVDNHPYGANVGRVEQRRIAHDRLQPVECLIHSLVAGADHGSGPHGVDKRLRCRLDAPVVWQDKHIRPQGTTLE